MQNKLYPFDIMYSVRIVILFYQSYISYNFFHVVCMLNIKYIRLVFSQSTLFL